ncbi:hypothetical protein RBSWK_01038 [Rhodopirellula baltica SWK14]|uniref:Uncharacterized protein n=2 Tax=Rhodopirellula baltica TaxID=265606 RepID=L7CM58_RHOBT|nr:hypothetical protein RBSWK_01038 [Rhodopirellula baltica SWK14]
MLLVAVMLLTIFCNVSTGHAYTGTADYVGKRNLVIIPVGSSNGIVATSRDSYAINVFWGIVIPISLVGIAAFIAASPRQSHSS